MSPSPDVAIVTANFGGFDHEWRQEPQDIPVDWIYHTDSDAEPEGWKVVRHTPNGLHPCLAAKRFKMLPEGSYRFVIWIDANIRIISGGFAREALHYARNGIAVHSHPLRNCIYQEALETIFTPKYAELPVADQIRHYRLVDQYDRAGGLFACGVIAWDRSDERTQTLGQAWMAECERWGYQDQLSFPVVCKRLGIKPGTFPHPQYESPWFRVEKHR